MSQRIFVGNLPFSATNDRLNELFGKHGAVVSAEIVNDRFTERSRGFGFVEMSSPAESAAAISALNGQELDGRAMTVSEAKPRPARSDSGERGSRERRTSSFGTGSRW